MKETKPSEYYCENCNKDVNENDKVCPHCGFDLESAGKENDATKQNVFKTAAFYGQLIEVVGWLLIIADFGIGIYLFGSTQYQFDTIVSIAIIIGLVLVALPFIAFGQFIVCHIQIEWNTRMTHFYLKKLYEKNQ